MFDVIDIFGLGKLERFGQNVKKIILIFCFLFYILHYMYLKRNAPHARERERYVIKLSILNTSNSCNANDANSCNANYIFDHLPRQGIRLQVSRIVTVTLLIL